MGLESLFLKARRWISGKFRDVFDLIPIQKPGRKRARKKRATKRKYKDDVEYTRNVHHIPLYKKFKQSLAVILLLFNIIFSQFLLGSGSSGQVMFLLFLGNSFILADYLWKMRKKEK